MRKRSRPPQGSDESRAEGPAPGEPRPAQSSDPGPTPQSGQHHRPSMGQPESGTGPFGKRRRRSPRGGESKERQGLLFSEAERTPPSFSEEPPGGNRSAAADGQAEPADAKKSRSKRRRERRKVARGGSPRTDAAEPRPQPEKGARPPNRPGPQKGKPGAERGGGRRDTSPAQPRPGTMGYPSDRRGHGGPKSGRPEPQHHARTRTERPPSRNPRPQHRTASPLEGLPAFTEEDIGALRRRSDPSIVNYASHDHGQTPGQQQSPAVRPLETLTASTESLAVLESLQSVIEECFPLSARHRAGLRGDIRELWEDLTSDRESRAADYLGQPAALSAYLRYFLPWNLYRLSSVLSNADFCLADNAVIVDIGSGPLTMVMALWAARPELRTVPLTIYCIDRVERILDAGRSIFETLCMRLEGRIPPWRIETRKDVFGAGGLERAHLLTAANLFNEFFWKDHRNLGERAIETARTLLSYLRENGSLFILEPGDPRSGAFISAIRAALLAEGASPLGPCPHSLSCPMPGIFKHLLPPDETRVSHKDPNVAPSRFFLPPVTMPKSRDKYPWCHFGIDTERAPAWLHALSEEAGLPKEKASLSYLWAARGAALRPSIGFAEQSGNTERERKPRGGKSILVRVISEAFDLPDGSSGQYACSSAGYTLLKRQRGDAAYDSGSLLEVNAAPLSRNDLKSGAIILPT